jgi:hypothetical protein
MKIREFSPIAIAERPVMRTARPERRHSALGCFPPSPPDICTWHLWKSIGFQWRAAGTCCWYLAPQSHALSLVGWAPPTTH